MRPSRGVDEAQLLSEYEQWRRQQEHPQEELRSQVDPMDEDSAPPSIDAVLKGSVVEREPCGQARPPMETGVSRATPVVAVLSGEAIASQQQSAGRANRPSKRTSLFARHVQSKAEKLVHDNSTATDTVSDAKWGKSSRILQGSGLQNASDVVEIHRSNVNLLESSSAEQLQQMREQILGSLSKESVAFVKKRRSLQAEASHTAPRSTGGDVCASSVSEVSKRRWMQDVPDSQPKSKAQPSSGLAQYSARFDFEGQLLPYDAKVSVTAGLHHHGEEPDRAGYSLEELLILFRSTNTSQRVLAMSIIAKIVTQFKEGRYDHVLENNVLQSLLENGLLLLLRSLLDDRVETLRESALYCLRQIVDNQFDELALDQAQWSLHGHRQPSLESNILKEQGVKFLDEELEQINDAKLVQLDVVLALLRTNVLERFEYMFQTLQPSLSAQKNMLSLLVRMARHSRHAALLICHRKRLLKHIADLIKPSNPDSTDVKIPTLALKLFRLLSAWDGPTCQRVVGAVKMVDWLPALLVAEGLSSHIVSEAFAMWDVALRYGQLDHLFSSLYPVLLQPVVGLRQALQDDQDFEAHAPKWKHIGGILKAVTALRVGYQKDIVTLLVDCVIVLLKRFPLWYVGGSSQLKSTGLSLLTISLAVLEQSYIMATESDQSVIINCVKELFRSLNDSEFGRGCFSECSACSGLLAPMGDGRERDPQSLPSIGAIAAGGKPLPTIASQAPFDFFTILLRLAQKVLANNPEQALLRHVSQWCSHVRKTKYFQDLVGSRARPKLASNWFSAPEQRFLTEFLVFSQSDLVGEEGRSDRLTWKLAVYLLPCINSAVGAAACHKLLDLVTSVKLLERAPAPSVDRPLQDAVNGMTLLSSGDSAAALSKVQTVYERCIPSAPEASLVARSSGEAVLPVDWVYLPMMAVMNRADINEKCPDALIEDVAVCLELASLTLERSPGLSPAEALLHLSRILAVFQEGTLFLEDRIKRPMYKVLALLYQASNALPDFSLAVPGVDSLRDFYKSMVEHFLGVSYGDSLFSLVLLLPTVRNPAFARQLWLDNPSALRIIRVAEEDLPSRLRLEDFTYEGCDVSLLESFLGAIRTQSVSAQRNPLLFGIARRNLSIYTCVGET